MGKEKASRVTHSYLSIGLAVAAMATGLWAAWRWLKAAAVSVPRTLTTDNGGHLVLQRMVESHSAMIAAAHLNKSAALINRQRCSPRWRHS